MRRTISSRAASVGIAALLVTAALATPAAADDDATALPPDGAASWVAWSEQTAHEAATTDWAALARSQGCELIDVSISTVVAPDLNASMGAPADLAVTVVERTETCADAPGTVAAQSRAFQAEAAGGCAGTHGPGTICIGRSGSFVTTSFRYQGSSTVQAYLRVYRVASTSACPTGSVVGTGDTQTYTSGVQRSLSVSAPTTAGYSSHVWRHVGLGSYTDWGAACGVV